MLRHHMQHHATQWAFCLPSEAGGSSRVCKSTHRRAKVPCRGCGGLKLASPRPYSQLDTDDVQTAIAGLRKMYPDAPILLAGFSMGAMLVTKYLAEARATNAASGGAFPYPKSLSAFCAIGCVSLIAAAW